MVIIKEKKKERKIEWRGGLGEGKWGKHLVKKTLSGTSTDLVIYKVQYNKKYKGSCSKFIKNCKLPMADHWILYDWIGYMPMSQTCL